MTMRWPALIALLLFPINSFSAINTQETLPLTQSFIGYAALAIFVGAYTLVMLEEHLSLRKSKPVLLAAGLKALINMLLAARANTYCSICTRT